ncbi:hypothetical protein C9374_014192 [Naegleria lovaniensis]|uniref:Uncharacterized protein n=1 Tax=Naegleria lovaniensis TaxID=51637 RepID=A0AA88GVF7_NAELO|nr:uncharacterized protein C9374_014192 [Naegleria lovaniensis]KAG2389632.1 hypothetical protein C9374_014192 [Naegleria lovaniensis]
MKRMNKFNREDYQSWLESFCFILTWLEDFTLSFRNCQKSMSLMNPPECDKLFHEKDFQGKSAIEYIEFEISSNLECDKRWLNALDLLKCFECKYVAARTMESIHGITTHANVITTPKHKKGILSALFISSQLSDEHVHPKSMSSSRSSSRSSSSSSSLTLSSTNSSLTAHSVSSSSLSDSLSSSSQSSSKSTSQHKAASMLNPRQQHGNVLKEFMRKLSMKKQ